MAIVAVHITFLNKLTVPTGSVWALIEDTYTRTLQIYLIE